MKVTTPFSLVSNLFAGLAGLLMGWVLIQQPLLASVPSTQVSWDASSCPAGTYVIISTAQSPSRRETYRATSTGIRLPRAAVIQQFPNLPPGQYSVTATVLHTDGRVFGSSVQTLTVPGGTGGIGHIRPPTTPPTSVAKPRGTGTTPALSPPPAPLVSRPQVAAPDGLLGQVISIRDLVGTDLDWRRMTFVDSDADGVIDWVSVELSNGEEWVLRLGRDNGWYVVGGLQSL